MGNQIGGIAILKTSRAEPKLKKSAQIISSLSMTKNQRIVYILVLGPLMMFQTLVNDLYLPAYPNIASYFEVPASFIQYSLSAMSLGSAVGVFIAGPLSDSLGRKRPMIFSAALFSISSFFLFLSPNIEVFSGLRFLQGFSSAAVAVISQAVIRDLFVGKPMAKMLGRVWLVSGLAPIFSTLIAAQFLLIGDWRVLPVVMGVFSLVIVLLANRALVETLHSDNRRRKGFDGVIKRFTAVFQDRIFVGIVLIIIFQIIGLFGYLGSVSFLYQDSFGLTPMQFSIVFSLCAVAWFIGIQLGAKLSRIFPAQWVILLFILVGAAAGFGLFQAGQAGLGIWVVGPINAVLVFSVGLSMTPIQTIALAQHGEEAGTAAAVLAVVSSLTASICGPFYPLLGTENTIRLGLLVLTTHLIALVILFLVVRPRSVPALVAE